jgi:hypothetical protein
MKKIKLHSILENLLWLLNPCLIILSLFGNKLKLGPWLSWLGQLHPVVLHFPIVLGLCIGLYMIANFKPVLENKTEKYLFLVNAVFSSIVAILGMFISKSGNYDKDILSLHQWGGLSIALLAWILFLMPKNIFIAKPFLSKFFGLLYMLTIIIFTHKGGQLTHGKNALALPKKINIINNANKPDSVLTVYEKAVQPILIDKCISCHGGEKIKGD